MNDWLTSIKKEARDYKTKYLEFKEINGDDITSALLSPMEKKRDELNEILAEKKSKVKDLELYYKEQLEKIFNEQKAYLQEKETLQKALKKANEIKEKLERLKYDTYGANKIKQKIFAQQYEYISADIDGDIGEINKQLSELNFDEEKEQALLRYQDDFKSAQHELEKIEKEVADFKQQTSQIHAEKLSEKIEGQEESVLRYLYLVNRLNIVADYDIDSNSRALRGKKREFHELFQLALLCLNQFFDDTIVNRYNLEEYRFAQFAYERYYEACSCVMHSHGVAFQKVELPYQYDLYNVVQVSLSNQLKTVVYLIPERVLDIIIEYENEDADLPELALDIVSVLGDSDEKKTYLLDFSKLYRLDQNQIINADAARESNLAAKHRQEMVRMEEDRAYEEERYRQYQEKKSRKMAKKQMEEQERHNREIERHNREREKHERDMLDEQKKQTEILKKQQNAYGKNERGRMVKNRVECMNCGNANKCDQVICRGFIPKR